MEFEMNHSNAILKRLSIKLDRMCFLDKLSQYYLDVCAKYELSV